MSFKIALPPGIVKATTPHSIQGRWVSCDRVRFVAGKPEKIGGWEKRISSAQTVGKVRGLFGWVTSDGGPIVSLGTYIKLYSAIDSYVDRTPIRSSGTLANDPFAVTDTLTLVTVTHTSHGLATGAYVTFSGASAGGGITINGEYVITKIDANSYSIVHSAAATSTDSTTGGAAAAYSYQINPGYEETSYGVGYGAGPYNSSTYGTPRTGVVGVSLEMRVWSIAKYGKNVLVSPSGGGLYLWDEDASVARAVITSGAPTSIRAMFVTAENYPVALGTSTPLTIAWPDIDDITLWDGASTNRSNARALPKGNKMMGGAALSDVNILWSDTTTYIMQYVGDLDVVYDTRVLSENAGLIGPLAFCVAGLPATAFWMSAGDFLMFDGGTVRTIPNQMDIREDVFRNMDARYSNKFWAAYNAKKNEVWFGYVRSGDTEVGNVLILSLADYSWAILTMTRTGMTNMPVASVDVIMSGSDRYLYNHETGLNADGAAMESSIRSGMLGLGDGDVDMDIDRYIHDFERQTGVLTLTVDLYERPNSASVLETTDFEIGEDDVEADMHMGGRHAQVEFNSNVLNGDWRMASPLFSFKPAGQR